MAVKISVKSVRTLLDTHKLWSNEMSKPKIKSSTRLVWPLRLFHSKGRANPVPRDIYTEEELSISVRDSLNNSYVDGFNMGYDGVPKKMALKGVRGDSTIARVSEGFRDGRRIKRFIY